VFWGGGSFFVKNPVCGAFSDIFIFVLNRTQFGCCTSRLNEWVSVFIGKEGVVPKAAILPLMENRCFLCCGREFK
ncbi:hypothetical protein, partial [Paenibacillus sp. FSL R7-0337]|uniref:hypothetical protein n=1 Tax=Paenibacillus sp. FSL R7-0337 TaxID=1926588 RepID=UPI001C4C0557